MPLPTPNRPGRPSGATPSQGSPSSSEEEALKNVKGPASYLDDDEEEVLRATRATLPSDETPALPAVPFGEQKLPGRPSFFDDDEEEEVVSPSPAHRPRVVPPPLEVLPEEEEEEEEELDDEEEEEEEAPVRPVKPTKGGKKLVKATAKKKASSGKSLKELAGERFFGGASKAKTSPTKRQAFTPPAVETEDTFIDKKKGVLLPFGSGRTAKVSEFDSRNNLELRRKTFSFVVYGLAILLMLFGIKDLFFPDKSLSEEQVASISKTANGDNGFPAERAKGFATDFMKAYLSINNSAVANRMLAYYYTGSLSGEDARTDNRIASSDYRQEVLYGPTVYSYKPLGEANATSGSYVIGAVVQPSTKDSLAPQDGSAAHLSFFTVNVYYDKKTDSFTITPDSPTAVPATSVGTTDKLPAAAPLGNGTSDDDLAKAIQPVVFGYVKGYATATASDHSALDQYVTKSDDPSLVTGMGGRYTLQGDDSSVITLTAYGTDDPDVVKADVQVKWTDAVNTNTSVNYVSDYVMTLIKQDNGKYLVAKFTPKYYVPSKNQ